MKHKIIKEQIEYEKRKNVFSYIHMKKITKYKLKFIKYKFQVPI